MENQPSWGYPKREDVDNLLDAYALLREEYKLLQARLEFILLGYVETESGEFTFPDGEVWPSKLAPEPLSMLG